jgi:histone H2A
MSTAGTNDHAKDGGSVTGGQNTADQTSIVSGGKRGAKGKGKGRGGAKGKGRGKGKGKGKHGGKSGGKAPKAGGGPVSRSTRAGLHFPVGRIHRRLKDGLLRKQRCGGSAAIYCAALLEYLVAEVIELAGHACKELNTKRIQPRHLLLAIRGDEELSKVITATVRQGGVVPQLHEALQKKKKSKATA